VKIDRKLRTATITVFAPRQQVPSSLEGHPRGGDKWWPLAMARELDDAILMLRTNDLDIGTWIFNTRGDAAKALAADAALKSNEGDWFVRQVTGFLRRTLARLDVSSRTLFAVIDKGSCFAGTLLELVLAADPQLHARPARRRSGRSVDRPVADELRRLSMVNQESRVATHYCGDPQPVEAARSRIGEQLQARAAADLGLVTFTPDDLDWDEEVRIAIEERASLSPDALTAWRRTLRFSGKETMETRIFGQAVRVAELDLQPPNAVGEHGALKVYGSGAKAKFNWTGSRT